MPVYNDEVALERCLSTLTASRSAETEVIVVDDGSTDDSAGVAARLGPRVIRLPANVGPAAARNVGARHARGDILVFVDSDVVVAPGMLEHVATLFGRRPDVAAVFGSYDAHPPATGVVSRYKNLLHHFVHQHGHPDASTFWAGCGAIRRRVFEAVGGFDAQRFRRPSIEDIELGYRLREAGHRILLDKTLQATHLKRWTLRSLLWSDVVHRALPWSRLIVERQRPVNDLNVRHDQRLSAALVGVATVGLLAAPFRAGTTAIAATALLGVIVVNRRLYAFFVRRGGLAFAAACLGLHWLYYLYSGLVYLGVRASASLTRGRAAAGAAIRTEPAPPAGDRAGTPAR